MSNYHRPWWVLALKAPLLAATVEETAGESGTEFRIEGRPSYQSTIWVTCGPGLAFLGTVLLAVVGGLYQVREQPRAVVWTFVGLMLATPALLWLISGWLLSNSARRHLARQIEAETVRLTLRLDHEAGQLHLQRAGEGSPQIIPYRDIRDLTLMTGSGARPTARDTARGQPLQLVLETSFGPIEILETGLGNAGFKSRLAARLRQRLHEGRLRGPNAT